MHCKTGNFKDFSPKTYNNGFAHRVSPTPPKSYDTNHSPCNRIIFGRLIRARTVSGKAGARRAAAGPAASAKEPEEAEAPNFYCYVIVMD